MSDHKFKVGDKVIDKNFPERILIVCHVEGDTVKVSPDHFDANPKWTYFAENLEPLSDHINKDEIDKLLSSVPTHSEDRERLEKIRKDEQTPKKLKFNRGDRVGFHDANGDMRVGTIKAYSHIHDEWVIDTDKGNRFYRKDSDLFNAGILIDTQEATEDFEEMLNNGYFDPPKEVLSREEIHGLLNALSDGEKEEPEIVTKQYDCEEDEQESQSINAGCMADESSLMDEDMLRIIDKVEKKKESRKNSLEWIKNHKEELMGEERSCRIAESIGRLDTWECVKRICEMSVNTRSKLFGFADMLLILRENSPSEAIEKVSNYIIEQNKMEKIKVGDECYYPIEPVRKFIVTKIIEFNGEEYFDCVYQDGSVLRTGTLDLITKTGRHFDVDKIWKEMK